MAVYPPGESTAALQLRVEELDVEVPRIPIREEPVRFRSRRGQVRPGRRGDTELSGPYHRLGARNSGVQKGTLLARRTR